MSVTSQVYLLAAGNGARAGGPKAWIEMDGRSLLKKQVDFLLTMVDPERITVSIQAPWLAKCRGLNEKINWVAVDPEKTPLASLQALVRASPMLRWSFVYHVDQPVWERELFQTLLAAAPETEAQALVPAHEGRRGHPVLLSHGLGPAVLELDPAKDRLDAFLRAQKVQEIPVSFACATENWNGGIKR